MCITISDQHLCGHRGDEIGFSRCHSKREAIEFMRHVYAPDRTAPMTADEDCIIQLYTFQCERAFRVWDEVRLARDCAACLAEAERLGPDAVALECGRRLRAFTGRRLGESD